MLVYHDFFATRIRIHVSWGRSGSGQMTQIRNTDLDDPINLFFL